MLYKPTHPKLLPDHIEFTPNISPVCPSFDGLDLFDGIINKKWTNPRMAKIIVWRIKNTDINWEIHMLETLHLSFVFIDLLN